MESFGSVISSYKKNSDTLGCFAPFLLHRKALWSDQCGQIFSILNLILVLSFLLFNAINQIINLEIPKLNWTKSNKKENIFTLQIFLLSSNFSISPKGFSSFTRIALFNRIYLHEKDQNSLKSRKFERPK